MQRANKEKAALADKAKAEAQHLHSSIASLKADVLRQKQDLEAQQSKLHAASGFEAQLSELKEQLEKQKHVVEAKEGQVQEAVSSEARLVEVWSAANLTYLFGCTVVMQAHPKTHSGCNSYGGKMGQPASEDKPAWSIHRAAFRLLTTRRAALLCMNQRGILDLSKRQSSKV